MSAKATRTRLPTKRRHEIRRLKIGGHAIHVTVSLYPDGSPAEVFLDMHKQGAPLRTFAHAFAMALSIGMQHGVPASAFVSAFSGLAGEPCGDVEGDAEITSAASIPDLVAKLLASLSKASA